MCWLCDDWLATRQNNLFFGPWIVTFLQCLRLSQQLGDDSFLSVSLFLGLLLVTVVQKSN